MKKKNTSKGEGTQEELRRILEEKITGRDAALLKQDLVDYQVKVLHRPLEKALETAERAIAAENLAAEEFRGVRPNARR